MFFLSDECRGNDICKCGIREILELCYRFGQEIHKIFYQNLRIWKRVKY